MRKMSDEVDAIQETELESSIREYLGALHARAVSENTVKSYERDLCKFQAFCATEGICSPTQIEEQTVRDFLRDMEQKKQKNATIARCLSALRTYFHHMILTGRLNSNPVEVIRTPRIERELPHILTPEEVTRLLNQPSGTSPKSLRDRAMLELLYATGIRVSELVALAVEDVNLNMEYLLCGQIRGGRVVPFGKKAKKALEEYLEAGRPALVKEEGDPFLFMNLRGRPMTRQGFWKLLRQYAGDAGIEGEITPHTLRHSFAAHLVHNGADLFAVQEMMGYTSLSGTQVYAKMRPTSIREAYTKAHIRD